jgi:hypothetical protein
MDQMDNLSRSSTSSSGGMEEDLAFTLLVEPERGVALFPFFDTEDFLGS